jgi:chorismate dehydratase
MSKIKVAVVSYLNTRPLVRGFESGTMDGLMSLTDAYPSRLASMLIEDEVDMALIPVAMIPSVPHAEIVSDFCIATDGEVASVCIFSDCPIQEIEELVLDYQSRSSVALTRILLDQFWKISPVLVDAKPGFEDEVAGKRAALIIGDRALEKRNQYSYIYDLGSAWKEMTGLPFVFAVWVANKKLPADFLTQFNQAIENGFTELEEVIQAVDYPHYDIRTYYTQNILYKLNHDMRKGMDLFLSLISNRK